MPNCFQLYRKSKPEAGPVPLNMIDAELCGFLNEPVHPQWYCFGWFDWIGFLLAMGKDWSYIRSTVEDWRPRDVPRAIEVIDWFESNFTSDCFVEIGRR